MKFIPNNLEEADYVALQYVHPLLAAVLIVGMRRYMRLSPIAVRVAEGFRTKARAAKLAAEGKGIVRSLHCEGLAVDLAVLTPDRRQYVKHFGSYQDLNRVIQLAASEFGAVVEWGGSWPKRDGTHWQLDGHDDTGLSLLLDP